MFKGFSLSEHLLSSYYDIVSVHRAFGADKGFAFVISKVRQGEFQDQRWGNETVSSRT